MIVIQGHRYAAGVDGSVFVPNSLIRSNLAKEGFTDILVTNRSETAPAVIPLLPPGTTDAWDTLALATRAGPTADFEVPDRVRWFLDVTPPAPAESGPVGPSQGPQVPDPAQVVPVLPVTPPAQGVPVPVEALEDPQAGSSVVPGLLLVGLVVGVAWWASRPVKRRRR